MLGSILMAVAALSAAQGAEEASRPPVDRRMEMVRNTDTVFTMPVYATREAWEEEKETIRRRILLGSGLYPLPEKTPLNEHISGKIERDGYSIEKVYFEAWPGFLVTGNLYRPHPLPEGKIPAVLCPHGHWEHGRLHHDDKCSVPARCITLARMGATVFAVDMVGYNDSIQFSKHRWLDRANKLYGLSPFSLQLWSSIRAVDFLQGLPEVDAERIGCTGASGGGTQTFALYAVDERIKVAAPVNMISCSMQGGCVCENGPLMRQRHNNMEIGAAMAPRPMLMISATGDWTRETGRIEYPGIRGIYALYGAEDRLEHVQVDAGHNYNLQSREAMYRFFAQHLLGLEGYEDFTEPPVEVEAPEAMRVFPDGKLPEGFLRDEALLEHLRAHIASQRPARRAQLRDAEALAVLQEMAGCSETDGLTPEFVRTGYHAADGRIAEEWYAASQERGESVRLDFSRIDSAEAVPVTVYVGSAPFSPAPEGDAVLQITLFSGPMGAQPEEAPRWLKQLGMAFNDTFFPSRVGVFARELQLAHAWAKRRRDISGLEAAVALDPIARAALLVAGVPRELIREEQPEKYSVELSEHPLEEELYIPAFLTLFEPRDLGLE